MKTVYKWYCRIETAIVAAGFFAIVALTFSNAVLRAFNQPIVAADDICTLLFAWVSFMGADVAMRANRLVGMDLVTMHLPAKLQKTLQLIVYVVMIATICLLIVKGVELGTLFQHTAHLLWLGNAEPACLRCADAVDHCDQNGRVGAPVYG